MKKYIFSAILVAFCISCSSDLLETEVSSDNTPQANFNLLWQDFDKHYGLFTVREHNWDSIYNAYQPKITSETTDDELWDYFEEMLAYLDDSHTFIYDPYQDIEFESGSEQNDAVENEFSLSLIKDSYLDHHENLISNVVSGKLANTNIGYLYLTDFEMDDTHFMSNFILQSQDYDALILDIRNNTGGVDKRAEEIAGRFANQEDLVFTVQTRNGDNHDDFTDKANFYSKIIGEQQFIKPVIVLTDQITVSSAEIFLIYMKSFPTITQIGDTTAGDFSGISMRRFLPNGWQYQYSIMMYLLPEGRSLDGIGHIPDVFIRNTVADISANTDKVMERAIAYLNEVYGIE
jgi:carboxyl-terminal processing protease